MQTGLILAFIGAAFVISLVPGPDMLYVIANGMAAGSRAGLIAALGMSTGLAVHTTAAALGLSAILQAAPVAMEIIRLFGIGFLAYLAFEAFRASRREAPLPSSAVEVRSLRRVYAMGVLTNLANPKIILFYLAFFPQFVSQGGWPIAVQMLVLGALFITIGIVVDGAAGFAAGRLSDFLTRRRGFRRWMDRACAGIFGALAVRLVVDDPVR